MTVEIGFNKIGVVLAVQDVSSVLYLLAFARDLFTKLLKGLLGANGFDVRA